MKRYSMSPNNLNRVDPTPGDRRLQLKNEIVSDEIFSQIITTKAFQRLKHISFLGAIDYVDEWDLGAIQRSRYMHSISVGAIAKHVCELRDYEEELTRHIVTAALLHDIGHLPLSHSVERLSKDALGYGHHEIGSNLIDGTYDLGKGLHQVIKKRVDIEIIKSMMDGAWNGDGGELFCSPINVDTIDGIVRASRYLGCADQDAIKVAEAAFVQEVRDSTWMDCLDAFWAMKNSIYADLINSPVGLYADNVSDRYFRKRRLTDVDVLADERNWRRTHSHLFGSLMAGFSVLSDAEPQEISFISRSYFVNKNEIEVNRRYKCDKKARTAYLSFPKNVS